MKKILIIILLSITCIYMNAQPVGRLPYYKVRQAYQGDTTEHYFHGDSSKWYTSQSAFSFDKPVYVQGSLISGNTWPADSIYFARKLWVNYFFPLTTTFEDSINALDSRTELAQQITPGDTTRWAASYTFKNGLIESDGKVFLDSTAATNTRFNLKGWSGNDYLQFDNGWFYQLTRSSDDKVNSQYTNDGRITLNVQTIVTSNYAQLELDTNKISLNFPTSKGTYFNDLGAFYFARQTTQSSYWHTDKFYVDSLVSTVGGGFPYSQELTDNVSWTSPTGKYFYLNSGSATNYSEIFSSPSETYLLDWEEATSGDYEGQLHIGKGVVDFYARASDTLRSVKLDSTGLKINAGHSTTMANIGGVLKSFYTDASTSGTGETDMYTYTVPANVLVKDGGMLIFEANFNNTGSTAAGCFVNCYFGGSSVNLTIGDFGATNFVTVRFTVMRLSSSSAYLSATLNESSNQCTTKHVEITSLDFTTTNIIKTTGQCSSNSFTAKNGYIEYKPAGVN